MTQQVALLRHVGRHLRELQQHALQKPRRLARADRRGRRRSLARHDRVQRAPRPHQRVAIRRAQIQRLKVSPRRLARLIQTRQQQLRLRHQKLASRLPIAHTQQQGRQRIAQRLIATVRAQKLYQARPRPIMRRAQTQRLLQLRLRVLDHVQRLVHRRELQRQRHPRVIMRHLRLTIAVELDQRLRATARTIMLLKLLRCLHRLRRQRQHAPPVRRRRIRPSAARVELRQPLVDLAQGVEVFIRRRLLARRVERVQARQRAALRLARLRRLRRVLHDALCERRSVGPLGERLVPALARLAQRGRVSHHAQPLAPSFKIRRL